MTATPSTPTTVEPGQIWRDNDQRTKGSGEFVVLDVVSPDDDAQEVADLDDTLYDLALAEARLVDQEIAIVRRSATHRRRRIRVDRLLGGANTQRGYTYLGMSR